MSDVSDRAREIKHTGISRVLSEYLQERLDNTTQQMIKAKEINDVFKLQGRAVELTELIDFFKETK